MRELLEMVDGFLRKFWFAVENTFLRDERGDSNMVAVIVLIVIVIAVAIIFRDALIDAVEAVMDQFTEFIEETGN